MYGSLPSPLALAEIEERLRLLRASVPDLAALTDQTASVILTKRRIPVRPGTTAPAGGSLTAIAFAVLLLASLGGLAILNVAAVRRRR